jgi:biotin carboxyl carrier protein
MDSTANPPKLDRMKLGILIIAVLFVVMPFLFWRSTWFGMPLSDRDMQENFADTEHPRKAQHALTQVGERMTSRDPQMRAAARQWYPQVIALASHPRDELRLTAAWVMGQDNQAREFHEPLARLLADANPMVRHNAALALVRFGDASGRDDILGMLRPYQMLSPAAGALSPRLQPGDVINPGTLIARIKNGGGETEIRSQVSGRIDRWLAGEGTQVHAGDAIVSILPSADMVWEALRALALIGRPEDEIDVEFYTHVIPTMPVNIRVQAMETIRAIQRRQKAQDATK